MTAIPTEIRQAIAQAGEAPVELTDPETNATYVIIRAELYERMRALCDEFDIRELYPMMNEVAAREGWDDPAMDVYNDYQPPAK